jgi:hypothetical protein
MELELSANACLGTLEILLFGVTLIHVVKTLVELTLTAKTGAVRPSVDADKTMRAIHL